MYLVFVGAPHSALVLTAVSCGHYLLLVSLKASSMPESARQEKEIENMNFKKKLYKFE